MLVKYRHISQPDKIKTYDTEKALKNNPFIKKTQEEFDDFTVSKTEKDFHDGILLAYEIPERDIKQGILEDNIAHTDLTRKAFEIACEAHYKQTDKGGNPYIFHPYHVARQMTDEISVCVALLHDVVEDTNITMGFLEREFPEEITNALKLLTHDKNTSYTDYIKAIKTNPVATAVKLADIEHNMDFTRIKSISDETKDRLTRKYSNALKILTEE